MHWAAKSYRRGRSMPDRVRGLSRTFSSQAEEADQDAQVSMLASQEMSDNSSVKMGEESFRHQNVSFQKEVMEEETFPVEPQGQPALIKRLSTKIKDFRRKLTMATNDQVCADESFVAVNGVLNPYSVIVRRWNKAFLLSGMFAFGVDPLFFYALVVNQDAVCTYIQWKFAVVLTVLRSFNDLLYFVHICLQFRIAYVSLESMSAGRGELVVSKRLIALNYVTGPFVGDVVALMPLPQIAIWFVIPKYLESSSLVARLVLVIALLQYVPRLAWMLVHYRRMKRATGVIFETAWSGFALNLLIYFLLSHILGACWYLFTLHRVQKCLAETCHMNPGCDTTFLQCGSRGSLLETHQAWATSASADALRGRCLVVPPDPKYNGTAYDFGIYSGAVDLVTVNSVQRKWLYSFYWGLQALSTTADNLTPTKSEVEVLFVLLIIVVALLLFSLLVANMQTFLGSLSDRMEDYRTQLRDWESWMKHRRIPQDLRKQVKEYGRHWWAATRGVNEDQLLDSLPRDLRSQMKFHMCMNLICRVPLFSGLDHQVRQALCEELHQCLFSRGSHPLREGDPVSSMLFVLRGELESFHTEGGVKRGRLHIRAEGFYGLELLRFVLERSDRESLDEADLPPALNTLRCIEAVDAFSLDVRDLAYVVKKYRLRENGALLEEVKRAQEMEREASERAAELEAQCHVRPHGHENTGTRALDIIMHPVHAFQLQIDCNKRNAPARAPEDSPC